MKDRCIFNIHKDENNEVVVEYGVPCSSIDENCFELWKRPDGTQYMRICGEGVYSDYEWATIQTACITASIKDVLDGLDQTDYTGVSFEEYCLRKSMLGSIYGSTNKEDTNND